MKPNTINYLLAHSFWLTTGSGALIAIVLVTLYLGMDFQNLNMWLIALAILLYILAGVLGFILGAFPCWMLIGSLVSKIHGSPYHVGDTVCVLSSKYKGTVSTVYEVWESRGQVKVDLGSEAKELVEDVFLDVAVFKMKSAE